MKKYLLLLLSAMFLYSCGSKQPAETSISKNEVDLTGNAFQSFRLGGEVKLLMSPDPDDNSKWMIRATTPLQKIDDTKIDGMTADINLLDANGVKVREGFSLTANDIASLIPVFNANRDAEKTLVFSAGEGMKKDFSFKEASDLIMKVKKIGLTINVSQSTANIAPQVEPTETESTTETPNVTETQESNKPLTLNDLLKEHGVYGLLAQYDKLLKKGEKKKAKQIEDRLYTIEKKVKNDSSIPYSLRERFVDYIEDKEDEIEDRY
jgi:hypothetical protein